MKRSKRPSVSSLIMMSRKWMTICTHGSFHDKLIESIILNELKNWIHFTGHHLLLRTTIYWPIRPPLQPPPGLCFSPLVFTGRPHLVYRHRQFRHLRRFPGLLPQKTEGALQVEALWIYRIWPLQPRIIR